MPYPTWSCQGKGLGGSALIAALCAERTGVLFKQDPGLRAGFIFSCLPASYLPDELHVVSYFQAKASGAEMGKSKIKQKGKLDCFVISSLVTSFNWWSFNV